MVVDAHATEMRTWGMKNVALSEKGLDSTENLRNFLKLFGTLPL